MKHVKRYKELFEAQNELSQEQTEWLDKCTIGKWTLNPQTGLVDVNGGFYLSYNPVSESVLKSLYKEMQSGMSWPDAVAEKWDSIESEGDKILLAPYNPNFSPDEKAYYQAIGALKRRSI